MITLTYGDQPHVLHIDYQSNAIPGSVSGVYVSVRLPKSENPSKIRTQVSPGVPPFVYVAPDGSAKAAPVDVTTLFGEETRPVVELLVTAGATDDKSVTLVCSLDAEPQKAKNDKTDVTISVAL